MILLSGLLFAQEFESGKKVKLRLVQEIQIEGWFSFAKEDCLILTNAQGRKGYPVNIIQSYQIDGVWYNQQELKKALFGFSQGSMDLSLPKRPEKLENMIAFSILNSGIPFLFSADHKDAVIAGITDLSLTIVAGVGLFYRNNLAFPLFIGLGGFKTWAAVESYSRQSLRWDKFYQKKEAMNQPCL